MSRIMMLLGLLTVIEFANVLGSGPKLKLVNVLFRHADRTPDTIETYPTDPYGNYVYYPVGRGGLTNIGKQREYQLGMVLKHRYQHFLGSVYTPDLLEARSTDYDRTKMCLQLVLTAMFPPAPIQRWNKGLAWQPIPTDYRPVEKDNLLFPIYGKEYVNAFNRLSNTTEMLNKVATFDGLSESILNHTGLKSVTLPQLHRLYNLFISQESLNLTLPDWTSEFYPDGELYNVTIFVYEMMSYNDELKRHYGGILLEKILMDTMESRNGTLEAGKKLFLYSAHEINVAAMLITLGVWKPHIPAYSSAVIVEILEEHNKYFVKVLYYKGIPSEVVVETVPGCSELCPLDKFVKILKPVTATASDRK